MPVYAPHGLRTRVDPAHAFTLVSRIVPHADALRVLELAEAIDSMPIVAAPVAAAASFATYWIL
jgi:hypothetical protein